MTHTATSGDSRALTPVLGLVLLIGAVAAASVGIFLIGTNTLESTEEQTETDQVESSFVQFSHDIATVSSSNDGSQEIDLGTEQAVRKSNTGQIIVNASGSTEPLANESIGSIEYETDDRTVAYQAGGVWRGSGNETQLLSAPTIHYRNGSLTLPIPKVAGEEQLSSERIRISQTGTESALNGTSFVEGELVTVTIKSEYYVGWAEFFESRTSETDVTTYHNNETVVVDLGQPAIDGDFAHAIVAQGDVEATNANACIDGPILAAGAVNGEDCDGEGLDGGADNPEYQPLDTPIEMIVAEFENDPNADDITGSTIDDGNYFVDGDLDRNSDLTIDVTNGNATIVIDGDLWLRSAEITVERGSTDNVARVYTTGDAATSGGVAIDGDNDDASGFQLYGTSEMHFGVGQEDFTGAVYAPRNEPADGNTSDVLEVSSAAQCNNDPPDADVCLGQGSFDVNGSIIAGPAAVEQNSELTYDPALQGVEPELALDTTVLPPPLTHMSVNSYEMDIRNERDD